MTHLSQKIAGLTALALLACYALSFATARAPLANGAVAIGMIAVAAVMYARSFTWGTAIVLAELVGGSLGRLFVLPGVGGIGSIRMGLFAVALGGTIWHVARNAEQRDWILKRFRGRVDVCIIVAVLLVAFLRGLWNYPAASVIADANAYGFLLLFPTVLLACREETDRDRLLSVVFGAAAAVGALSLVVLFLFTHGIAPTVASPFYRWIRDFGLGEATPSASGFVRVFFQAHLWSMIVALWSVVVLTWSRKPEMRWVWIVGMLCAATVFLSFSRTLWIASAAGLGLIGVLIVANKGLRPRLGRFLAVCAVLALLGALPPLLISRGAGDQSAQRATTVAGEAAADSRMNLLRVMWPAILAHPVLGSGFGKPLTYVTRDPRLLAYFPDGNYTTTAFEWGWLDMWLKLGILGMLMMLIWAMSLVVNAISLSHDGDASVWPIAIAGTTAAIVVAHVFSPWLNHPLGLGYLMLATAVIERLWRKELNMQE